MICTVPKGDNRSRCVCQVCHAIHYSNPKLVTGCLPIWEGKILLCKRSIEPRFGYWTLPSGYMEDGETVEEGAARETWEESRAEVEIERLFAIYSIPRISQVYLLFLAQLNCCSFGPTEESSEVSLVSPEDIPWEELAFPAVEFALRKYVEHGSDHDHVFSGGYTGNKPPLVDRVSDEC